jgi:hypothetical protein
MKVWHAMGFIPQKEPLRHGKAPDISGKDMRLRLGLRLRLATMTREQASAEYTVAEDA